MKYLLVLTFILMYVKSFSQKTISYYIEISGYADRVGNVYLDDIAKPKKLSKMTA